MINHLFYSPRNKNAIKSVIYESIESKTNNKLINNYDVIINETMEYVLSQVSSVPPKGVKEEEYLFLMNKKVFDIVYPIIEKKEIINIKEKVVVKQQQQLPSSPSIEKKDNMINNSLQNNLFDPILLKNFETQSLMDYPKPSAIKNSNEAATVQVKKLEDDRSTLTPKIRPIDFTVKTDNENKGNTMDLYNELLVNYNNQVDSMSTFENNQKNINKKVEFIEENQLLSYNDNVSSFTPIDLLKNKNEASTFFETNNNINNLQNALLKNTNENVAYNRNDVETFISNMESNDNKNILNNDINTYNRSQIPNLEFSDSYQSSSTNHLLIEPSFKLLEKSYYVVFDSLNRDFYEYPNPTSFQVKFSPASNNYLYESFYDKNNTLILMEKNIVYATDTEINIQETFDNITSISCSSVIVPTNIVWYGADNLNNYSAAMSIYNEPYIFLVIPEIKGPYRGGNTITSNSFSKLIVDETSNTPGSLVNNFFTNLKINDKETFIYSPVTAGKIDKMTLNIFNRNGQYFNFGIDKLYIESFQEGNLRYNGCCGDEFTTTILTIQSKNPEYSKYCSLYYSNIECDLLNSQPINIANKLIYLFILFKKMINIYLIKGLDLVRPKAGAMPAR
jgi:hypothetical protein